jgi:copper chaperone CopZ
VRVALKGVKGVDSVDVSLNKGLATVNLKDGNAVTMKQLRDAIVKNGFSTKSSNVVVTGAVRDEGGLWVRASGSNEEFSLVPEGTATLDRRLAGRLATVEGVVPEAANNNSPSQLRVRSMVETK